MAGYSLISLEYFGLISRTGGRAVEGARLESVYTFIAYRGFESPSVRQVSIKYAPLGALFYFVCL
jgi:hypothetical protein